MIPEGGIAVDVRGGSAAVPEVALAFQEVREMKILPGEGVAGAQRGLAGTLGGRDHRGGGSYQRPGADGSRLYELRGQHFG